MVRPTLTNPTRLSFPCGCRLQVVTRRPPRKDDRELPLLRCKIQRSLYESAGWDNGVAVDDEAFIFGSFRLSPAQRVLLGDGEPRRLGSRAFDILVALIERAGQTVSKEELIARAWPGTVVEEAALRVHVAALRKALGDGRAGKRYIANHPGRAGTARTCGRTRRSIPRRPFRRP